MRLRTQQENNALRATKRTTTARVSTRQTHQVTKRHCSRFKVNLWYCLGNARDVIVQCSIKPTRLRQMHSSRFQRDSPISAQLPRTSLTRHQGTQTDRSINQRDHLIVSIDFICTDLESWYHKIKKTINSSTSSAVATSPLFKKKYRTAVQSVLLSLAASTSTDWSTFTAEFGVRSSTRERDVPSH